jgi:hypothetical protein
MAKLAVAGAMPRKVAGGGARLRSVQIDDGRRSPRFRTGGATGQGGRRRWKWRRDGGRRDDMDDADSETAGEASMSGVGRGCRPSDRRRGWLHDLRRQAAPDEEPTMDPDRGTAQIVALVVAPGTACSLPSASCSSPSASRSACSAGRSSSEPGAHRVGVLVVEGGLHRACRLRATAPRRRLASVVDLRGTRSSGRSSAASALLASRAPTPVLGSVESDCSRFSDFFSDGGTSMPQRLRVPSGTLESVSASLPLS